MNILATISDVRMIFVGANMGEAQLPDTIGNVIGEEYPILEVGTTQTGAFLLEHTWHQVKTRKNNEPADKDTKVFRDMLTVPESFGNKPVRLVFTTRNLVDSWNHFLTTVDTARTSAGIHGDYDKITFPNRLAAGTKFDDGRINSFAATTFWSKDWSIPCVAVLMFPAPRTHNHYFQNATRCGSSTRVGHVHLFFIGKVPDLSFNVLTAFDTATNRPIKNNIRQALLTWNS